MESLGHVFLIPSDGTYTASQGQSAAVWKEGVACDGRDFFSLMASLRLSEDCKDQPPSRSDSVTAVEPPTALEGCESSNRGKRGEAPRGRRLPDVEQLLMSRSSAMQQPRDALLSQLLHSQPNSAQQVGRRQEAQQCVTSLVKGAPVNPVGRRFQANGSSQSVKSSNRGRQGEKSSSSRSSSMLADSHLALQTALVTMLHLEEQGGLQRKPILPKRNLMCHSFLRFGTCPNRETCNYAHNTTELQKKLELRKTSLCKYWLRGKCENEDCNFAHGEHELQSTVGVFKTTICKYWKQGCCYSGEFCRHAHGDADLRPENLPPHLERKKQQQQQSRTAARNSDQRRERGGIDDASVMEDGFDRLRQKNEVAFDSMRQVICDGMLAESRTSLSTSSLDSLLAEMNSTKHWKTQGSSSSDRSTDILLSSASGSPRALPPRSGTSLSSASMRSLSPEHSFVPAKGPMGSGCGLSRPVFSGLCCCTEPALEHQPLELQAFARSGVPGSRRCTQLSLEGDPSMELPHAFGSHRIPSSLLCVHPATAAPPGPTGRTEGVATSSQESHCRLEDQSCELDNIGGIARPPCSERDSSRPAFSVKVAQGERTITWPSTW